MKKAKDIAIFIAIIFIISIITGFIYGINNPENLDSYLNGLNNNNNLFISNNIIIIIIFFLTLSLLNIIIEPIIIGIEGISFGYTISLFYTQFKIKGVIYSLITFIVNKSIFLLILLYLYIISFNYIKKYINNIIKINNDSIRLTIIPLLKKFLIIISINLLNNTLIYYFGNIILKYFTFML